MSAKAVYGLCALVLFFIEVLIALFVTDSFVRGYVGDALAVAFVYAVFRAVTPMSGGTAVTAALAVAFVIEIAQGIFLLRMLGLHDNWLVRTVLGGVFDWKDIAAYFAGAVAVVLVERIVRSRR